MWQSCVEIEGSVLLEKDKHVDDSCKQTTECLHCFFSLSTNSMTTGRHLSQGEVG